MPRPLLPLAPLALLLAACRPAVPDVPAGAPPAGPSVTADSIVIEDSTLLFFVRYRYPQLRDAGPHTAAVNRALADSARAYVAQFRPEGPPPERSYAFTTELDVGFDVFRLDDRLFSALYSIYTYTGGAHPNADFEPVNVDLTTGQPFGLDALFRPGAAYLDTLSAHVARWIPTVAAERGGTPGDFWAEGWAPEPANFARFTVGADSLHFSFPPYQIAPYVAGAFDLAIPLDALRPLLAADGPGAALHP